MTEDELCGTLLVDEAIEKEELDCCLTITMELCGTEAEDIGCLEEERPLSEDEVVSLLFGMAKSGGFCISAAH